MAARIPPMLTALLLLHACASSTDPWDEDSGLACQTRCGAGEFQEAQTLQLGAGGVRGLSGVRDVVISDSGIWVAGTDSREVLRLDKSLRIMERITVEDGPTALVLHAGVVHYALGTLGRVGRVGADTLAEDSRLVAARAMASLGEDLVVASGSGLYRVMADATVSEIAALPKASALHVDGDVIWSASREGDEVVRITNGERFSMQIPDGVAPEAIAADEQLLVVAGRGLFVGPPSAPLESVAIPEPFGINHGYDDEVPATIHAVALTDSDLYATTFYGGYIARYPRNGEGLGTGELLSLRPPVSDDDWDEDSYGDVVGWDPTGETGLTRLRVFDERLYVSSAVWGYVGVTNLDARADETVVTQDGDGGVAELGGAYSLALSPDNKHLYVGAWNNPEPSGWAIDANTSILSPLVAATGAPLRPVNYGTPDVAVAGDGGQVFAIDDQFNRLHVYDRDEDTGLLTWRAELADDVPLELLVAVAAAPDGRAVWASDFESDALVSFVREPTSGDVMLESVFREGQDGVVGLAGSEDVVPSPDDRHVYVVAFKSQGVSIWNRSDDGLVYSGLYQGDSQGPNDDGMYGVEAAALTRDGIRMVLISPVRDRIFVLDRDAVSGALVQRQRYAFADVYRDTPLANRQADPGRVAISNDGKRVYLSLRRWNAVGAMRMDASDGRLLWEHTWVAPNGSDALTWPNGVQVSPRGDLWVASLLGDSVTTLTVRSAAPGEQDGCGGTCP